jgi:hypothetical protein
VKRIALVAGAIVLALSPSLRVGAQTSNAPRYSSYGADAGGTGVHALGGSNAFPNFRTGAVDNSYPLATSHLDLAASQATASVADTGPLGATGAGQANGAQQPQYATASYPGQGKASLSQGGSVAEAEATPTSAHSRGSVAAATSSGGGAVEKKDDGAQTSSDYGESNVAITPDTGAVIATGDGRVDRAAFAGGVFVVSGAHVTAEVRIADGVATPAYTVDAGNATVNGTPVKITDKGVESASPPPGGSDALQQVVNGQLNEALTAAGLQVFLTAPDVVTEGASGHVAVSGLHVRYTQPNDNPAVPTQSVEYILGEARAFAFVVPSAGGAPVSAGAGTVSATPAGGATSAPPATRPAPTTLPAVSETAAPPAEDQSSRPIALLRDKPTYLVWLYLIWQALVVGTGAALLWWRRAEVVHV